MNATGNRRCDVFEEGDVKRPHSINRSRIVD
jgi:hypothetical protein